MKGLDFQSPYSRLGMFLAAFALLASNYFTMILPSASGETQSLSERLDRGGRVDFRYNFGGNNPQYNDFIPDFEHRSEVANFRDLGNDDVIFGSAEPCFSVAIDPTAKGYDDDYRLDMFGGQTVVTTEQFRSELEGSMAESFKEEAWARDRKCFNGSFIVSFDVRADGRLGTNMLVHHLMGSSSEAGFAVLDVLRGMDRAGHRWHDGAQPAGEVRVPVSFRLE